VRLEYQFRAREIITTDHDRRVYGERVKPGWILKVLTCFLHMPKSKIGHIANLLVDGRPLPFEIRSRARDAAKQGMSALNPFYVGENQRVVGHSPDSNVGDEICLTVIGEMIPLKKWRRGKV